MTPTTNRNFNVPDPHTYARPEAAVVTHLELALVVDFPTKTITGLARYLINKQPGAREIILDTRDLEIEAVLIDDRAATSWSLEPPDPILGQALRVALLETTREVSISYRTTARSAALQWLTPAQTAGRQHPFLFTQSQAILARTWLPCQDSPGIRFTYNAKVQVPAHFLALMSAENPKEKIESGMYTFVQRNPIPAYLMALAVGDLAYKAWDGRTGLYAEHLQLPAGHMEFNQLPRMLQAAEALYGPYLWGRYDLLLLPPSFPFGGMENPLLTFVTPTILAGDRSLTSLVAHELAHSWSGNLVTNATWNDFWLNEGFTVYFERRIMEVLEGPEYADMLKVLGYQDLQQTLQEIGPESTDTHLKLNLAGRDPDEGLTEIAYEKGNYFLLTLEALMGRDLFDTFVRNYFTTFAFQAMDTERFLDFLEGFLAQHQLDFDLKQWVYHPGLPENRPPVKSSRFEMVQAQVEAYLAGASPEALPTAGWSTHEWLYFLHALTPHINHSRLQELDNAFHFTKSGNAEIKTTWLEQTLRHHYEPARKALEEFLLKVGRRKFLVPLYKLFLQEDPAGARRLYQQARPNYHAVTTVTLDNLLTDNS